MLILYKKYEFIPIHYTHNCLVYTDKYIKYLESLKQDLNALEAKNINGQVIECKGVKIAAIMGLTNIKKVIME